MLARIAAVAVMFGAAALLGATLIVVLITGPADFWSQLVQLLAIVAAVAAIPFVFCLTGNRSAGAVDNASGLVSVLLAAREIPARPDIGVIVTSAEEFALAGARAHVASHHNPAVVINCDTIDDPGSFLCMTHGRTRGSAAAAVSKAAARLGLPVKVRRTIPGILADGIAFADAGWDAVTVSRGNLSTLARVHTSSDTRERLDGSGIAQAARLLAATIEELR
jgi:Zn-dependent M28 family amino/carboxypeptidase